MRVLITVDWRVARLEVDSDSIQSPDKVVKNSPYWFFKHWPDPLCHIDVLDVGRIPLVHAFEGKVLNFYIAQAVAAFSKRKKYDLIISHSARSALVFSFLRSLIREQSPPHVLIDVGSFNGGRENRFELCLIRKASESLRGIITHSAIQSEYYKKHMPLIPHRFVHFGVDADYFRPRHFKQEDYILSFGAHHRDFPTLIEAWKSIRKKNVRLRIIGVDRIPGVTSVPENVEILGRVPIPILIENILKARFVVIPLPYLKYSYGQMSFLQSMALGKSCIVTKTPSSQDYLKHNENALLVRPYDQNDLAEKITLLLEDEHMNDRIALNARGTIESTCNERHMAVEMYNFISELI
jgi:glycosyltransferase involved in cell wall biosynthesis